MELPGILGFFMHFDDHLMVIIQQCGAWTYLVLFGIIFAETGLWYDYRGNDFFYKNRMEYPDILGLGDISYQHGWKVVLRQEWQDYLKVSKHSP